MVETKTDYNIGDLEKLLQSKQDELNGIEEQKTVLRKQSTKILDEIIDIRTKLVLAKRGRLQEA